MTFDEAQRLRMGQLVYMKNRFSSDGRAVKFKVDGVPQTSVIKEGVFTVALKMGSRKFSLTDRNARMFVLNEPLPRVQRRGKRLREG